MSEKIMGGVSLEGTPIENVEGVQEAQLPANIGVWPKIKAVLFHEIRLELTPKQQEVFSGINDFLHIELTWQDFHDFLFQEISFRKNK